MANIGGNAPRNFQEFERLFRAVRDAKAERRVDAVGLLTPQIIRRAIEQKQDVVLQYGKSGFVTYTPADLKRFVKFRTKAQKEFSAGQAGVPVPKLISASLAIDIKRANQEIKSAVLYRISTSVLHFRTNAGPRSKYTHHQVRVRLDSWSHEMLGGKAYKDAVKAVVNGRVSLDCDCGRWQYWYRYLATIGEFALTPLEKDFPKIRNPQLVGCCCKHILRCLHNLRTPGIQSILVKEMERQAKLKGFHATGKAGTRMLSADELKKAARASSRKQIDKAAAQSEYDEYLKAQDAFKARHEELKKQMQTERAQKEQELKAERAKNRALKRRAEQLEKELEAMRNRMAQDEQTKQETTELDEDRKTAVRSMMEDMQTHVDAGTMTRRDMIENLAKYFNLTVAQVDDLSRGTDTAKPPELQTDGDRREAEARAQKAEAEKREADAHAQRAEAEKREAEARAQKAEAEKQEAEARAREAAAKAQEAEANARMAVFQAIKGSLMMFAPLVAAGNMTRDAVINQMAAVNNLPIEAVEALAREVGL